MATTPPIHPTHPSPDRNECQTLRDVRRWRKEVYEARQRMTSQEREQDDRATEDLARKLGLRVLRPEELVKPQPTR